MNHKNKILFFLAQRELEKNKRFRGLHADESCYVFGNGNSLKGMNLAKFTDKISIGCNSLFLHQDFYKLDCRYYQIPASHLFLPYRSYYKKMQRNYLGDLFREKIKQYCDVQYFLSLSNYFTMRGNNIFYNHHFGQVNWNIDYSRMDGIFSFMKGSIYSMLGTAIYMGFKEVILVGCDYTFMPIHSGHFFEKGESKIGTTIDESTKSFFEGLSRHIKITTITSDDAKSYLDYRTYSDYTGEPMRSVNNRDIIDSRSLDFLHQQGFYEIY